MALKRWYADLRSIEDNKEYLDVFNELERLAGDYGSGLNPTNGRGVRVFSCLLDVEENPGILRDYGRYLSLQLPEM